MGLDRAAGLVQWRDAIQPADRWPAGVTRGGASPPLFRPIAELVAQALPRSTTHVFESAGHLPHVSHPQAYADTVGQFCRSADA